MLPAPPFSFKEVMGLRKLILFLFFISFIPYSAPADTNLIDAKSTITAVTVYPDRAMVTRRAGVRLEKGDYSIRLTGLPGGLLDDSIRVSGRGSPGMKIGTVEVKREYLEAAGSADIRALEKDIQALRDDDKRLSDELGIARKELEFYQAIQFHNAEVWSREITLGNPGTTQWAEVAGFVVRGQREAAERQRALEVERRALGERLSVLTKRLDDMRSSGSKEMISAVVEVSAEKVGDLDLSLSYVVVGASWYPLYEARSYPDKRKVELAYQGMVRQNTSEDWDGVELTLSTARPAVGASPPELRPWYISSVSTAEFKRQAMLMNQAFSMPEAAAPEPMELEISGNAGDVTRTEAAVMTASASDTGTSAVFRAATRQTIPADGSAHKVALSVSSFEAVFEYYTVPKLMPYAYLKGTLVNDTKVPLLAGGVSVFLGDDYKGVSAVKQAMPGEKFDISMGADDGVRVKRERVRMFEEDAGLLSKTRRISYEYVVTVENLKDTVQKITLKDQFPVSQQEEISVEDTVAEPAPDSRDKKGFLTWNLELGPRVKKEIKLGFSVEFPKGLQLKGM